MRHFQEISGGVIDMRCYRSPAEMGEFCSYATAVSRVSYQGKLGFGFPDTREFTNHVLDEAAKGRVSGFVLMHRHRPIAYVFCRISGEIITYTIPGYDPEFVRLSPGTVLICAILQQLFEDENFRIFDFGGQAWDYKALFATGWVNYIKVTWFPTSAKNLILVMVHYLMLQAWRGAAFIKTTYSTATRRIADYASSGDRQTTK